MQGTVVFAWFDYGLMERADNPRLRGHKLTEVFESESAWELTGRFQVTTIQRMRSRDILSSCSAQRMLQSMTTLSHGMAYHVCEAVSRLPLRMSAHILGSMSGLVGSRFRFNGKPRLGKCLSLHTTLAQYDFVSYREPEPGTYACSGASAYCVQVSLDERTVLALAAF